VARNIGMEAASRASQVRLRRLRVLAGPVPGEGLVLVGETGGRAGASIEVGIAVSLGGRRGERQRRKRLTAAPGCLGRH
jgi:hypothetical protein